MRDCELCKRPARMYCESDRAMLCWNCDERVHRANFLVEKHTRCLLCHVCQSLTPWKASGSRMCPTASVCVSCAENHAKDIDVTPNVVHGHGHDGHREESEVEESTHDDDHDNEEEDDNYDDDEEDEEEEVDTENQVVPWSSSPTPVVACTSSFDASVSSFKRVRHDRDLDSDDEIGCLDLTQNISDDLVFHRPMKQPRLAEPQNFARVEDEPN